jgi:hypothetical protein
MREPGEPGCRGACHRAAHLRRPVGSSGLRLLAPAVTTFNSSCPGLSRASKSFFLCERRRGWPGRSPAMTVDGSPPRSASSPHERKRYAGDVEDPDIAEPVIGRRIRADPLAHPGYARYALYGHCRPFAARAMKPAGCGDVEGGRPQGAPLPGSTSRRGAPCGRPLMQIHRRRAPRDGLLRRKGSSQ